MLYLFTFFSISDDFSGELTEDTIERTLNAVMPISLFFVSYLVERLQLRLFFENKNNIILHQEMKNIFEAIPEAIIIVNNDDKAKEVLFRNHNMNSMIESIKLPNQMNQSIFRSINDYFNNSGSVPINMEGDNNYQSNSS
jgi:hypothetical protein